MYLRLERQAETNTYKIIANPNPKNKQYIGYIYKPHYKYIGLCPHRFVYGKGLVISNENETPSILHVKRSGAVKVFPVHQLFEASKGFDITLNGGMRAATHLANVLFRIGT